MNVNWGGGHVTGSLKLNAIDKAFIKAFLDPLRYIFRRPSDKVVPTALW